MTQLPYGVDYRERDMEVILEQMMTQPIFVGDHVDSSMHQLIYMVRSCFVATPISALS